MKDPVRALLKFGRRDRMDEFVYEGHLYMNHLGYFIDLEADEVRGDRREAAGFQAQAPGAELRVQREGQWSKLGTLSGPVVFSPTQQRKVNVFCMYAVRGSHIEDRPWDQLVDVQNLSFGDTYVILTNGDEFVRRVKHSAERANVALVRGLVEYVDLNSYHGPLGLFRKASRYEYQSEFRFAVLLGSGAPYSLYVGDLSDIAMIGELEDLNRRLQPAKE